MIDGNRIKFGYGSVAVGCDPLTQMVTFKQIKPPCECGSIVEEGNGVEYIGEIIKIHLDISSYSFLMRKLSDIDSKKVTVFEHDGYLFDFSNYNCKSVNVLREKARNAIYLEMMAMAC